jgi:hypothetical protein
LADRAEEFRRRGETYIERIVAEEGAEGRRTLGRFCDPEQASPVVVTTSRLLSTGVDIPTCKNVVLARPVNSMVEFKQIIGRGTRLVEPQKTWFTIVDYSGATKHFYDEEWDGDPEFVDLDTLLPVEPSPEQPAEPTAAADTDTTPPSPPAVAPGAGTPAPTQAATTTPAASDPEGIAPSPTSTAVGPPTTAPIATPSSTADGVSNEVAVPASGGPSPNTAPATLLGPTPAGPVSPGELVTPTVGTVTPAPGTPAATAPATSVSGTRPPVSLPMPGAEHRTRRRDGRRLAVVGEIVYELGPDGRTLREIPYVEYAREAIGSDCPTLQALRERWLNPDLRRELQGRLEDDGVDLAELGAVFNLGECDPLDVLAHALFRTPVPSRQDRVARLRERHVAWLDGFPAEAREILDVILRKFCDGEAPEVTDTDLLRVPPLSERGTFMELAQRFGGGAGLRSALAELHRRLYEQ